MPRLCAALRRMRAWPPSCSPWGPCRLLCLQACRLAVARPPRLRACAGARSWPARCSSGRPTPSRRTACGSFRWATRRARPAGAGLPLVDQPPRHAGPLVAAPLASAQAPGPPAGPSRGLPPGGRLACHLGAGGSRHRGLPASRSPCAWRPTASSRPPPRRRGRARRLLRGGPRAAGPSRAALLLALPPQEASAGVDPRLRRAGSRASGLALAGRGHPRGLRPAALDGRGALVRHRREGHRARWAPLAEALSAGGAVRTAHPRRELRSGGRRGPGSTACRC